jgi:hypothetical protein
MVMSNAAHFTIRCLARPRGNMIDILVNGRAIDAAPEGGALLRRVRGLVLDLRQEHAGATVTPPGAVDDIFGIIRDASILIG